jgi:hypothetical protein
VVTHELNSLMFIGLYECNDNDQMGYIIVKIGVMNRHTLTGIHW